MKRDEIRALIEKPSDPGKSETAARIYANPKLWPEFERAFYSDAEPTDAERQVIRRVVAERCGGARERRQLALREFVAERLERISGGMRDFALAAAPRSARSVASASGGGEPVTFVFVSEFSDDAADRKNAWRAELTLPPDAAVDAMLPISVTNAFGEPVADGVFKVAGVALPVVRGRAEIPYGMFLSGLKDAQVELTDAAGIRTQGTLALF